MTITTITRWGALSAVLASLIWSWNFVIARSIIDAIPAVTLAFLRWSTAIVFLLPFSVKPLQQGWEVARTHPGYLLLVSLLGVTLFNTLVYIASETTTALNLSLIAITFPVFIVLFSFLFLDETITRRRVLGILMVIASILYLTSKGVPAQLLQQQWVVGDLWMLLAAIIFALYSILVRRKPKGLGNQAFLIYTFLLGWVLLIPWMVWEQQHIPWPEITLNSAAAILFLALFTSIASYFLWNYAVISIGATNAGMIYYTLPIFAGFEAWLVLEEPITVVHWISTAGILCGIYLSTTKSSPR